MNAGTGQETPGGDLRELLMLLRRRALIIVVAVIAAAVAVFLITSGEPKRYTAVAGLWFPEQNINQQLFGSGYQQQAVDPTRVAATDVELVSLQAIDQLAAKHLHGQITADELRKKLNVSSDGQSDIVTIEATDHNPVLAAKYANAVANEYVAFSQTAQRAQVAQGIALTRKEVTELDGQAADKAEANALQTREAQLKEFEAVLTGNAQVVQAAVVPTSPSGPTPARDAAIAGILALLATVLLVVALDRLDRRISDMDELEHASTFPILVGISQEAGVAARDLTGAPLEAFSMLRARLRYFNVDRHVDSVLVTSAAAGDGKSTIAWGLACAAALTGDDKVLLIEADLRNPSQSRRLALPDGPGLAEVLSGEAVAEDVIQDVLLWRSNPGRVVHVLQAGYSPPNPASLLESHAMATLLADLRREYDFVVIDTSPLGAVSDAFPLLGLVAGVIVVARLSKVTHEALRQIEQNVQRPGVTVLGLVANGLSPRGRDYYGYGYGYGNSPQKRRQTSSSGSAEEEARSQDR